MAVARDPKSNLSKNVLKMKFMQRSVLRVEREEQEAEQQRHIDTEHWVLDLPPAQTHENPYQLEPSHAACGQLKFGRFSFRGFNPEIEKLMKSMDQEQGLAAAAEREQEISINDEEMAERYSSLVGTIGKKFSTKRKGFLKPRDSDDDEDEPSPEKSPCKAERNPPPRSLPHDSQSSEKSKKNTFRDRPSRGTRGRGRGRFFTMDS